MPADSWGFVVAGYVLTGVTLLAYVARLRVRERRARRRLETIRGRRDG